LPIEAAAAAAAMKALPAPPDDFEMHELLVRSPTILLLFAVFFGGITCKLYTATGLDANVNSSSVEKGEGLLPLGLKESDSSGGGSGSSAGEGDNSTTSSNSSSSNGSSSPRKAQHDSNTGPNCAQVINGEQSSIGSMRDGGSSMMKADEVKSNKTKSITSRSSSFDDSNLTSPSSSEDIYNSNSNKNNNANQYSLLQLSLSSLFLLYILLYFFVELLHFSVWFVVILFYSLTAFTLYFGPAYVTPMHSTYAVRFTLKNALKRAKAPHFPPKFADVFIADALCSLSRTFFDWGVLTVFFISSFLGIAAIENGNAESAHNGIALKTKVPFSHSNNVIENQMQLHHHGGLGSDYDFDSLHVSSHFKPGYMSVIVPFLYAAFPFILRAIQCFSAWKHTPDLHQKQLHILNGLKYSCSLLPPLCGLMIKLKAFDVEEETTEEDNMKWEQRLLLALTVSSCCC
jgi:hypothetical protein